MPLTQSPAALNVGIGAQSSSCPAQPAQEDGTCLDAPFKQHACPGCNNTRLCLLQVGPDVQPRPSSAPLANGTYYLQSVGGSEACNFTDTPYFLTRPTECSSRQPLSLQPLSPNKTLTAMWQISLVPGDAWRLVMILAACGGLQRRAHLLGSVSRHQQQARLASLWYCLTLG